MATIYVQYTLPPSDPTPLLCCSSPTQYKILTDAANNGIIEFKSQGMYWMVNSTDRGKITVAYHIERIGSYRDHKADSGITIKMTDE